MKAKSVIFWLIKLAGAGLLALITLTIMCFFYYNPGTHISSNNGATDYVWEKEKFYCKATEGAAYGRIDSRGYNNEAVPERIDILMMGSSHMEAFNVSQDENAAASLNEKFNGKKTVYNIGMSAHKFYYCAKNLSGAIVEFKPAKYVVIETNTLNFNKKSLDQAASGTLKKIPSYDSGLLYQLQRNQYFKLLYKQLKNVEETEGITVKKNDEIKIEKGYQASVDNLLKKLSDTCESYNCKLIILYQPSLILNQDGSADTNSSKEAREFFRKECELHNIVFADMTDDFLNNYADSKVLPHGFSNTAVGQGHLNKYGHKMIAEKLYKIINSLEEEQ